MATECIAQVTFNFDPKRKPVVAVFDAEHASSDGGAILLKGIDTQLGLTKRLAACLDDPRQPGKIQHQTLELFRQRVFGMSRLLSDGSSVARSIVSKQRSRVSVPPRTVTPPGGQPPRPAAGARAFPSRCSGRRPRCTERVPLPCSPA